MKKYTILSFLVFLSIGLFAQQATPKAGLKLTKDQSKEMVTRYTDKAAYNEAVKAFGDVLFSDDFGSGGPATSNLPTGWTTVDVDAQANGYVWQWTDEGATGPSTTGYEYILASATAANGWMILDSDNYGQGSYDAMLISPSYDVTGYDAVAISFTELYQRWGNESANPYGGNPTLIGVSTDGGVNWTEIEIHADFAVKDATTNPGYMMVNISNVAGGASDLKVYFRMKGLWDYWWQIDDFKVIEAPYNDLIMKEHYVESYWDFGTEAAVFGYYSMLPLSQVTPFYLEASVYNNGIETATNPVVTASVFEGTTSQGTFTATTATIDFDSTYVFYTDLFVPTAIGDYSASFGVVADATDELLTDNNSDTITWKITENDIMARDYVYTRALGPNSFVDATDGDFLGVKYFIADNAAAKSISVFIDYRATIGTILLAKIYFYNGTAWQEKIRGEEYVITAADLGHWIELPFYEVSTGDADLEAESQYNVGLEFYWNNEEDGQPWVGADDEGPHDYQNETSLRIGTTWYYIDIVPMVRLNLSTATVPPVWNTILSDLCAHPTASGSYTKTVSATDPNGLSLSFTAETNDVISSFVDNGNGTATFTIAVEPADIDEPYLFEYNVSNGVSDNSIFTWITIVEDVNCAVSAMEYNDYLNVSVYPNPTIGILNIDNALNSTVTVLNILGETVLSKTITSTQQTLDISNMAEGTYFVKVMTQHGTVTKSVNLVK
ncbi:MAG: T9SS type A sorting domain-containing protein [Bacteroidales bacterium]|nr:T9SS type A sorting domain-containing protein [Bacteroidales bacterium]